MSEEKIESVASESPEEEIIMDDGTVIRMSDLTFDDVVIPQSEAEPVKKEEKAEPIQ